MSILSESQIIDAFLDAMRACGVNMDTASNRGGHPIADGKLHRADSLEPKGKGKKHVWYVLHLDEPASGAFGDYKQGISETWTGGKALKELTKEERAAIKKRMDEARAAREAHAKEMAERAAEVAAKMLDKAASERATAEHPYLAKKGLPAFPGARVLSKSFRYTIDPDEGQKTAPKGTLLVPMYRDIDGSLALIGAQMIANDGRKLFLKGTPKANSFHPIGKMQADDADIFLAEGYATAARIHEATGCRAIAAFDAGNLKPVALAVRQKWPHARIIVMADNDRFTTQPVDNPGVTAARDAAQAIGGAPVIIPQFERGEDDATDFDDLAQLRGTGAICAAIDAVLNPPPPEPEYPPHYDEAPPYDSGEYVAPMDPHGEVVFDDIAAQQLESFGEPHFRCLGVDGLTFFYQPQDVAQVISLSASAHKIENLQVLAPLQWWETNFPAKKDGVDMKAAVNACIRACKHKRKFVPHNAMRGRGAWFEGETPVYHAGDRLVVGGKVKPIHAHRSRFVYDEGSPISVDLGHPLATGEARRFLDLCKSLRWAHPLAAYMLAGWCVVAPVCGFLKWRPHLWINGKAGSGKSTVMDKIIKPTLASTSMQVVGNTSEAGIRQELGMDALPIIFDEAEPRDMESKTRLKAIMDLTRVAASESDGLILKGSAGGGTKGYRARSMFVFASINMQIEGYADESRFTQLTLLRPDGDIESDENKAHYAKLVSDLVEVITPSFSERLLARTIALLPRLREYVRVFTEAATLHLGAQRLGDQIGPMLAGAYLLNTDRELTVSEALDWIKKNDWSDLTARDATQDNERFLHHITGHLVRHNTPEGGTWERTVGELIELAAYAPETVKASSDMYAEHIPNRAKTSAVAALARLGMRIGGGPIWDEMTVEITTSYEGFRRAILKNTEWSGTKYREILKAIPGAVAPRSNRYFASGINTPYVAVPITAIIKERDNTDYEA